VYDEEDVKNAKRHRGDGEEVECGDPLAVVAEKSAPALPRVRVDVPPSRHESRDGAFGDIQAEHQDLAVDARRA
jgi:hypothetical protein